MEVFCLQRQPLGSTLLEKMLGGHSAQVEAVRELPYIRQ
tara:strand:+ start:320 stop:436 length:117 start_codon:yes stop_codon:yes gene_type:complete